MGNLTYQPSNSAYKLITKILVNHLSSKIISYWLTPNNFLLKVVLFLMQLPLLRKNVKSWSFFSLANILPSLILQRHLIVWIGISSTRYLLVDLDINYSSRKMSHLWYFLYSYESGPWGHIKLIKVFAWITLFPLTSLFLQPIIFPKILKQVYVQGRLISFS